MGTWSREPALAKEHTGGTECVEHNAVGFNVP